MWPEPSAFSHAIVGGSARFRPDAGSHRVGPHDRRAEPGSGEDSGHPLGHVSGPAVGVVDERAAPSIRSPAAFAVRLRLEAQVAWLKR